MKESGLGYRIGDKAVRIFTGGRLAEMDEFGRRHFRACGEMLGGMALVGYGLAIAEASSTWEGDLLGIPPAAAGFYFAARGFEKAFRNLQSQSIVETEQQDPSTEP